MQFNTVLSSVSLLFLNQNLLLRKNGERYELPLFDDSRMCKDNVIFQHSIGVINHQEYIVKELNSSLELQPDLSWVPLKVALEWVDLEFFGLIARAYQILNWEKNHQHCGRCGSKTLKKQDSIERRCEFCNLFFYPRISPSIIVLIHKGNQVLLARKSQFPQGVYGLIAGFVEAGENLEETIMREVEEEVGISVKNIQYFGSQSWPFPDSLMLAFTAEYNRGDITLLDGELEEANWYDIENLPGLPSSPVSIARKMLDDYLLKKKGSSFEEVK